MPREKQIGECTGCKQTKALFDVKNKICGTCAGKKGGSTPKKARIKYFCDSCKKPVVKGQESCACGETLNWHVLTPLVK